jgi:hypothetical protein
MREDMTAIAPAYAMLQYMLMCLLPLRVCRVKCWLLCRTSVMYQWARTPCER